MDSKGRKLIFKNYNTPLNPIYLQPISESMDSVYFGLKHKASHPVKSSFFAPQRFCSQVTRNTECIPSVSVPLFCQPSEAYKDTLSAVICWDLNYQH